jgi:hypothetical protein
MANNDNLTEYNDNRINNIKRTEKNNDNKEKEIIDGGNIEKDEWERERKRVKKKNRKEKKN